MWLRAIVALFVAIGALLGLSQTPIARKQAPSSPDWVRYDKKTAKVVRVVDGDTLDIDLGDETGPSTRVRLLGIDAPELAAHFGERSHDYLTARSLNQPVTLQLDETETRERDKHGRLLAYVYLPNNECVNESLIRDGMAYAYRTYPHGLSAQFETAERVARSNRNGMWKAVTVEQMPAWRQEWMKRNGITTP